MTQPAPQKTAPDVLTGWHHMTQVLAIFIPARLKQTHVATQALRGLRRGS